MTATPMTSERVFWHSNYGFVSEQGVGGIDFPGGQTHTVLPFADRLISSMRLPDLKGAPVASWLLARLFTLTNGHLTHAPFSEFTNHIAGYVISLIAFTHQLRPIGFLHASGFSDMITLDVDTPEGMEPYEIIHAFYTALVDHTKELSLCRWTIFGPSQTLAFGWSGEDFYR